MNHERICELFRKVEPFSELLEADRLTILGASKVQEVRPKEIVFSEGDEAEAGWVVVAGRIAMIKSSANGKELITELLPAGELFGIVAFVDSRPYPLTARAQCEGEVLRIPRRAMAPVVDSHPQLVRGFIKTMTARARGAQNLARALAHDKVETRIASVLLALIPRFGTQSGPPLSLSIGRQELADAAGTSIETASRVIKGLERDGVVEAASLGLLLLKDLGRLAKLSETE